MEEKRIKKHFSPVSLQYGICFAIKFQCLERISNVFFPAIEQYSLYPMKAV